MRNDFVLDMITHMGKLLHESENIMGLPKTPDEVRRYIDLLCDCTRKKALITYLEGKHTDTYVYGCLKKTVSIDSSSSNIRVSAPNIRSFGGDPQNW